MQLLRGLRRPVPPIESILGPSRSGYPSALPGVVLPGKRSPRLDAAHRRDGDSGREHCARNCAATRCSGDCPDSTRSGAMGNSLRAGNPCSPRGGLVDAAFRCRGWQTRCELWADRRAPSPPISPIDLGRDVTAKFHPKTKRAPAPARAFPSCPKTEPIDPASHRCNFRRRRCGPRRPIRRYPDSTPRIPPGIRRRRPPLRCRQRPR